MSPKEISFTGLVISPRELVGNRIHQGPYPASWIRVVIDNDFPDEKKIAKWVLENTDGRFGVCYQDRATIYFEDDIDAIIFRMRGGDDVLTENTDWFD